MTDLSEPTPPTDRRGLKANRLQRRQQRIRDEIERNRRGEYTVPTWVLVVMLIALVVGFTAFIALV